MNRELVRQTRLEFRESLLFGLQGFVLTIEGDAKFVRSGRKRTIEVKGLAGAHDRECGSGEELLVHEDGECSAVDGRRDFNAKRSRRTSGASCGARRAAGYGQRRFVARNRYRANRRVSGNGA